MFFVSAEAGFFQSCAIGEEDWVWRGGDGVKHVSVSLCQRAKKGKARGGGKGGTYVIVDGSEDLLGGEEEVGHFPDGHFEVHLREFEESVTRGGFVSRRE